MVSHPDVAGPTHEVFNQPPELPRYNAYQQDQSLHREGATWAETMVNDYGALVGGELRQAGFKADEQLPIFNSHDRVGHRIDEVTFSTAYHQLMAVAIESGWPTLPCSIPQPNAHVARALNLTPV